MELMKFIIFNLCNIYICIYIYLYDKLHTCTAVSNKHMISTASGVLMGLTFRYLSFVYCI